MREVRGHRGGDEGAAEVTTATDKTILESDTVRVNADADADDTATDLSAPVSAPPQKARRVRTPTPQRTRRPTPQRVRRPVVTIADSDPPTVLARRDGCVDLPSGSVVGEIYEIDTKLGAGAMGEVYAARHMKLGKRVAIKVIGPRLSEDAAAIERFAMEARTLAQIQHPAIVAVEHVGELADGRAYFVMEFLRGSTLFERLQHGRIPLSEALRILDQMARGLDAAHGEGVIHRDLKPENTFLVHLPGESPAIKLLDYGLAKIRADVDQRAERTQSGVAIGTPMYMSPEQMRGPNIDHRTDIYALGCVAYEMLLGVPPFPHARTTPELYAAHLHESPPLPRSIWPEIPPQLDLCLFAMLAKDPAYRPTLAQFRAVIANVRAPTQQNAATEFVGLRAARHRRRAFAIAAVVLAALVGGIIIGVRVGERGRQAPIVAPAKPPLPSESQQPEIPPRIEQPIATQIATPVDTASVTGTTSTPARRNVTRTDVKRQPSRVASPSTDAGVDAMSNAASIPPTQIDKPADKSVDRNQTINPFKKR